MSQSPNQRSGRLVFSETETPARNIPSTNDLLVRCPLCCQASSDRLATLLLTWVPVASARTCESLGFAEPSDDAVRTNRVGGWKPPRRAASSRKCRHTSCNPSARRDPRNKRSRQWWLCTGKGQEVEVLEVLFACGILAIIFVIAGFCELVGER